VRFRFAAWSGPGVLDVFTEAPPLPRRHLGRVPQWCAERHEELLSATLRVSGGGLAGWRRRRCRPFAPAQRRADEPADRPARHGTDELREPRTELMTAIAMESPAARDLTLRARDSLREPGPSSGHTLAGFPPGNLRATLRAPGASR
jgi:hypothetical protein